MAVMPPISISRLFWLWLPLGAFVAMLAVERGVPASYHEWLVGENGPYEMIQVVVAAAAFVCALYILARMKNVSSWIYAWIGLAALGCLYIAGEEISWGQHLLEWTTPEYWSHINDQQETNLHNTTAWLDQKPRLILIIGIYAGGLIIPLLARFKPHLLPVRFNVIYPPAIMAVTAGICLFIRMSDVVADHSGFNLFRRASESEEFFIFYFVFLYLMVMKQRLIDRT